MQHINRIVVFQLQNVKQRTYKEKKEKKIQTSTVTPTYTVYPPLVKVTKRLSGVEKEAENRAMKIREKTPPQKINGQ